MKVEKAITSVNCLVRVSKPTEEKLYGKRLGEETARSTTWRLQNRTFN